MPNASSHWFALSKFEQGAIGDMHYALNTVQTVSAERNATCIASHTTVIAQLGLPA